MCFSSSAIFLIAETFLSFTLSTAERTLLILYFRYARDSVFMVAKGGTWKMLCQQELLWKPRISLFYTSVSLFLSWRLLDSVGEGEGGMIWEKSIEICISSYVKQITSAGSMHETCAQGWCTGMTQKDGMGREAGGGSGWGAHLHPWQIHVSVWQKPLQYCKVISLQLK